jgi:hypothetical protein
VFWQIVESLLFNTLAASYKVHFVAYSIDKKHVNQLILATSLVWKAIYLHYLKAYPQAPFVDETPKDHLWETFKELKTCNSNEEGSKQATLQVMRCWNASKPTNEHATQNVLEIQ